MAHNPTTIMMKCINKNSTVTNTFNIENAYIYTNDLDIESYTNCVDTNCNEFFNNGLHCLQLVI